MTDLVLAGYAAKEHDRIVATLFDWLRIPSISAEPARAGDVRRSAEFVVSCLCDAGMEHVRLLETGGGRGAPAVYGEWCHADAGSPTVLVYGHHDVQPVDPESAWDAAPFEPVIVDGELRARGAIDDKGQVLYQIEAARGILATTGTLPVNLKFLVEGEEEVGSAHFEALLVDQADLLAADVIVVSDTGMIA
ncbi:MAG: M20/M25/M40 family metallo-hydrolase, partial [Actinomycetota bacterium]|nr:M20/M25/M40 family metallo-hydrolase [Actinomycetota bacterium]